MKKVYLLLIITLVVVATISLYFFKFRDVGSASYRGCPRGVKIVVPDSYSSDDQPIIDLKYADNYCNGFLGCSNNPCKLNGSLSLFTDNTDFFVIFDCGCS